MPLSLLQNIGNNTDNNRKKHHNILPIPPNSGIERRRQKNWAIHNMLLMSYLLTGQTVFHKIEKLSDVSLKTKSGPTLTKLSTGESLRNRDCLGGMWIYNRIRWTGLIQETDHATKPIHMGVSDGDCAGGYLGNDCGFALPQQAECDLFRRQRFKLCNCDGQRP